MKEIALHILDIAQNSITAGADKVEIIIDENLKGDTLSVTISDNGCGMTEDFLEKVTDPFTTKRTTRKVGLGIPLFKQAAILTGGEFFINSEVGKGTCTKAVFIHSSIDRQPLGDMAETMLGMITSYEDVNFCYCHKIDGKEFSFSTAQIKEILGDVPFTQSEVYLWLTEFLREGEAELVE